MMLGHLNGTRIGEGSFYETKQLYRKSVAVGGLRGGCAGVYELEAGFIFPGSRCLSDVADAKKEKKESAHLKEGRNHGPSGRLKFSREGRS